MHVLDVTTRGPPTDNNIIGYEFHSHAPYSTSFNANDEVRIPIHQQDAYTLPAESYLHLEFTITNAAGAALTGTPCVSGFFANLFTEIRYEINGVEVQSIRNPGVASLMKNAMTFERDEMTKMEAAGYKYSSTKGFANFAPNGGADTSIIDVPLRYLLGFAEDYRQILLNVKQELVLRCNTNTIDAVNVANARIKITRLLWRIPYIQVSDTMRLRLLTLVQNNTPIKMSFRHWELYTYPLLPESVHHTWTVKSVSQQDKPRYIIIALQTNKRQVATASTSNFNKCKMKDVRVFLNNKYYPYESIDSDDNRLFNMYIAFNGVYNCDEARSSKPLFERAAFEDDSMFLYPFDCSRQDESLKTGSVDIKIEFSTDGSNIPANTIAYCLMIFEMSKEYEPMTGLVQSA